MDLGAGTGPPASEAIAGQGARAALPLPPVRLGPSLLPRARREAARSAPSLDRAPWAASAADPGGNAAPASGLILNSFLPSRRRAWVEIVEGEALRNRMLRSYSKDPKGWSFVVSPSGSGFYGALASGPSGAWLLKMDSIFKPAPIVLGSEVEAGPNPAGAFPYGYRRLPPELVLRLLQGEGGSPREPERAGLASVLRSDPVVPEAGGSYAQGPFVLAGPGGVRLSERQRAVDASLTLEMRRLLRERYPAYG